MLGVEEFVKRAVAFIEASDAAEEAKRRMRNLGMHVYARDAISGKSLAFEHAEALDAMSAAAGALRAGGVDVFTVAPFEFDLLDPEGAVVAEGVLLPDASLTVRGLTPFGVAKQALSLGDFARLWGGFTMKFVAESLKPSEGEKKMTIINCTPHDVDVYSSSDVDADGCLLPGATPRVSLPASGYVARLVFGMGEGDPRAVLHFESAQVRVERKRLVGLEGMPPADAEGDLLVSLALATGLGSKRPAGRHIYVPDGQVRERRPDGTPGAVVGATYLTEMMS